MTQREQPPPPGDDVLEHAPGRWSPSRLADLPRWLLTGAAAVLLAGGGAALAASQNGHGRPSAGRPAAPAARADAEPGACGRFVNLSSFRIFPRYRLVLGEAALPPARLPPPSPSGHAAWPYGEQTAFEVHGGGPPVTIAVPQAWRDRVAVFGTTSRPPGFASTMRIPSCPPRAAWDIYVSDFYTRSRTACVPLRVQVRRQTMTLWFALGRRCRPGAR